MRTFLPPKFENRFTERAKHALFVASTFVKAGQNLDPLHLLASLFKEQGSLAKNILTTHRISPKSITRAFQKNLSLRAQNLAQEKKGVTFSKDCKTVLKRAAQIASTQHQSYIGTEHLLYAVVCSPAQSLPLPNKKLKEIKRHLETIFSQNVHLPRVFRELEMPENLRYVKNSEPHVHSPDRTREEPTNLLSHKYHAPTSALGAFCENLTALAEKGTLDPVIGREKEIARIMYILSRRSKNNPLLLGEPGVGKTAIVQGLAQKIQDRKVPQNLLDKQIYSLNMATLVAGTMFRGDFENRMFDILHEASDPRVILFIDEIHTVVGAGAAQGSLDVANILKPALTQGKLRCIGATTFEEYKKYIEKERALERRFQPVIIEEESEEQSIQTLLRLKPLYEKHHGVSISDEAVRAAVSLSTKYTRDRFLPDKALDLLDEAASRLYVQKISTPHETKIHELETERFKIAGEKEKAVLKEDYEGALRLKMEEQQIKNELAFFQKKIQPERTVLKLQKRHVEETISEISGVPLPKIDEGKHAPSKLKNLLLSQIKGQNNAIQEVHATILRNEAGIGNPKRPIGSFLFLGPSGVGKTALAKVLSETQHQPLIRLDMSEYAEEYTISRLLGSPPGYVGYGESGELTDKIRRHPYAVVLFDEIEKAHPSIANLLLQILEDGTLKDATGRSVTFNHAIIILTSNYNAEESSSAGTLGFSKSKNEPKKDYYLQGIKEVLSPEILSRIDKVIVFNELTKKDIFEIVKIELQKLQERIQPIALTIKDKVLPHITAHAWKEHGGARNVRTTIEKLIELPLATYLLRFQNSKKIRLYMKGKKLRVTHE